MYADLLYREQPDDQNSADFRFNLQTIVTTDVPSVAAPGNVSPWKSDLIGQINTFEQSFATRKAKVISKFDTKNSMNNISDSFVQALHHLSTNEVAEGHQNNSFNRGGSGEKA